MINDFLTSDARKRWDNVLNQTMPSDAIVLQFLIGKLDLDYLSANYQTDEKEKCTTILVSSLLSTSISRIFVCNNGSKAIGNR